MLTVPLSVEPTRVDSSRTDCRPSLEPSPFSSAAFSSCDSMPSRTSKSTVTL